MYHPSAMLTVAHTREQELVREAQDCGLPRPETIPNQPPRRIVVFCLWLAAIITALGWILG